MGLSNSGLTIPTLAQIKAAIENDIRANVGPEVDLSAEAPLGQVVGIFSSHLREVYELLEAVYGSQYRATATGRSLTQVAALTGTARRGALYSEVLVTLTRSGNVSATAGQIIFSVSGDPTRRFANVDAYTATGAGSTVGVLFRAQTAGPVRADAGTLTVLAAPVTGLSSGTNPADADLGALEESDPALRARAETELAGAGSTTTDAIRAALLELDGVESVLVLANDGDVTDGNGLPPHSVEAIVDDGSVPLSNDLLARTVFESAAGGIRKIGTTLVNVTDSSGSVHSVGFTRPAATTIYLDVGLTAITGQYAGDTAVRQALADIDFDAGEDVIRAQLIAKILTVPGVIDVPHLDLGIAPGPTLSNNIVIGIRAIAFISTGNVTTTATMVPGTP